MTELFDNEDKRLNTETRTPRCKNDNCNWADQVRGPIKGRFICLRCRHIFVADDLEVTPARNLTFAFKSTRARIERAPECFGNYDSECKICSEDCNEKKKCSRFSAPKKSDYYSAPPDVDAVTVECPKCGMRDQGKFCSRCGAELEDVRDFRLIEKVFRSRVIRNWPQYFRTLREVVFSPSSFFSGAFSEHSKRFHYESSTLNPVKFLVNHITFIGVAMLIGNDILLRNLESAPIKLGSEHLIIWSILSAGKLLLQLCSIYVPAFILCFLLKHHDRSFQPSRRVKICRSNSDITLTNVLKGSTYASAVEILLVPLFVLTDSRLSLPTVKEVAELQTLALVLGLIAKLIVVLVLLPNALAYACRVSKGSALWASGTLYSIPVILYCYLKFFSKLG